MANDRATNSVRRHDPPTGGSSGAKPEIQGELRPVVHHERGGAARTLVGRRHYAELSAGPVAASLARGLVGKALAEGGRADLSECAQLIVSELVTNAIKATADVVAGRTGDGLTADGLMDGGPVDREAHVRVGVLQVRDYVVVEVWDCSHLPPKVVDPAADEVGGRGLLLVSEMATEWGYRWHRSGGKVVWAAL